MKAEERAFIQFYSDFRQEVIRKAGEEEEPCEDAFTDIVLENLEDADIIEGHFISSHRKKEIGVKVNAYTFGNTGDARDTLDLFISSYNGQNTPGTLSKTDIDATFKRLYNFFGRCCKGYYQDLEEAQPVFDLALQIYEIRHEIRKVRFFLITDLTTKIEKIPDNEENGIRFVYQVWDIQRIYGLISSGTKSEPIEIDFTEDGGSMIPCLFVDDGNPVYTSYQIIMPGETLVRIYDMYGPRVLERNVRSFLQVRGNVNKGIRDTVRNEPEMFLAYNNGLSTTAENVTVTEKNGRSYISRIKNFQIVNGAQTTATLHYTTQKFPDDVDLSFLQIPVKLTVLHDASELDEFVPKISEYANTQNKIDAADFTSNNPFHVELDSLSRRVRAPAIGGSQIETYWYFERVRGQFDDKRNREAPTPAKKKLFDKQYPKSQKFTKPDIAIFEHIYQCRPYDVSLGRQKNYKLFMDGLNQSEEDILPDEQFFRKLVAKAILHKQTYAIVRRELKGSGYWANIVAYTVALLIHLTDQKIDLEKIWREQDLCPELKETISELIHEVRNNITNPPEGRNVTEWCKKEQCWEVLLKADISLNYEINAALISDKSNIALQEKYQESIEYITSVPSEIWADLMAWSRETGHLNSGDRTTAGSLNLLAKRNRTPTESQIAEGQRILEDAKRLGFDLDRKILEIEQSRPEQSEDPGISEEISEPGDDGGPPDPELSDIQIAIMMILHNNHGSASVKSFQYDLTNMSNHRDQYELPNLPENAREIRTEFLKQKKALVKLGLIERKVITGKINLSEMGKGYCYSQWVSEKNENQDEENL